MTCGKKGTWSSLVTPAITVGGTSAVWSTAAPWTCSADVSDICTTAADTDPGPGVGIASYEGGESGSGSGQGDEGGRDKWGKAHGGGRGYPKPATAAPGIGERGAGSGTTSQRRAASLNVQD